MVVKYYCVVDNGGYYQNLILEVDGRVQHYHPREDDRLIPTHPPGDLCRPKWDGSNWTKGATSEELEIWQAQYPDEPTTDRITELEQQVAELTAALTALMGVT